MPAIAFLLLTAALGLAAGDLDIVLEGGRVIDPETSFDANRNVGIRDGVIVAIDAKSLRNDLKPTGVHLNVRGHVVAPGFIDLHAHGQNDEAFRYRVQDGVTTALELEWGYVGLAEWLERSKGRSRIHYGASVSHGISRAITLATLANPETTIESLVDSALQTPNPLQTIQNLPFFLATRDQALPKTGTALLNQLIRRELEAGGLGIGLASAYYPGASRREIFDLFQFAGQTPAPIWVHVRERGMGAMQEVIANAAASGAATHIVHSNSSSGSELPEILQLIAGARQSGINLSVEAYPYTAGSTSIKAAFFGDDWQTKLGITYHDLQWQETGERLTAETFTRYRQEGGMVIVHSMQEATIELALGTPFVIIASDAMPYAPKAHPRSAGTFARVLGRYVREKQLLTLPEAIRRITIEPARRLEAIAPAMRRKGRMQIGADADIVVFNPETVIDTATFEYGLSPSKGIDHVLVAGTFVVQDSTIVEGQFPGTPILGQTR